MNPMNPEHEATKLRLLHELIDRAWEAGMRPHWDGGRSTRLTEVYSVVGSGWGISFRLGDDEWDLRTPLVRYGGPAKGRGEIPAGGWSAFVRRGKHTPRRVEEVTDAPWLRPVVG